MRTGGGSTRRACSDPDEPLRPAAGEEASAGSGASISGALRPMATTAARSDPRGRAQGGGRGGARPRRRGRRGRGRRAASRARRAGAVAHESLDPGAIVTLDADGGVDAEATGRLPVEHVGHGRVVQDLAPPESAEHTPLHGPGGSVRVVGRESGGFMEADLAGRLLAEEAVDGEDVVVEGAGSGWSRSAAGRTAPPCRHRVARRDSEA